MPLVTSDTPVERPAWRAPLFALLAALAFVLVLAPIARCTADGAGPVPLDKRRSLQKPPAPVDAGVVVAAVVDAGAAVDAGAVDAGAAEVATVEPEEIVSYDGGVIGVAAPPLVAADVAALVLPVVERCLAQALRFDPSIGGKAKLRIAVDGGAVQATLLDSPSPVLSTCVTTQSSSLSIPGAPPDRQVVDAAVALDGLRQTVKLEDATLR